MKKVLAFLVALVAIVTAQMAHAGQDEFCVGFAEGYKTVKGDISVVPPCPPAPPTPPGSTDFREGIKAGIRAAQTR
jgi:hypothetical protein